MTPIFSDRIFYILNTDGVGYLTENRVTEYEINPRIMDFKRAGFFVIFSLNFFFHIQRAPLLKIIKFPTSLNHALIFFKLEFPDFTRSRTSKNTYLSRTEQHNDSRSGYASIYQRKSQNFFVQGEKSRTNYGCCCHHIHCVLVAIFSDVCYFALLWRKVFCKCKGKFMIITYLLAGFIHFFSHGSGTRKPD